jgi:hypothetical protein
LIYYELCVMQRGADWEYKQREAFKKMMCQSDRYASVVGIRRVDEYSDFKGVDKLIPILLRRARLLYRGL